MLLAVALAVRAVRRGSVCLDLATVADVGARAALARRRRWADAGRGLAAGRGRRGALGARPALPRPLPPARDPGARRPAARLGAGAAAGRRGRGSTPRWRRCAPGTSATSSEAAVVAAVRRRTTILTGGPGTGKTTTVARLLALLADQAAAATARCCDRAGRADRQGRDPAPGGRRRRARRRRPDLARGDRARSAGLDGADPAPAARLAARQRHPVPARPRQPAQVRRGRRRRVLDGRADDDGPAAGGAAARVPAGAGRRPATSSPRSAPARCSATWSPATTAAPDSPVAALTENFRSEEDIKALAAALRDGDADERARACCARRPTRSSFVEADRRGRDRGGAAARLGRRRSRRAGRPRATRTRPRALAELDRYRLLCAHREGPYGVRHWNQQVERWLAEDDRRRRSRASGTSAARCW